ncbi:MAG: glycosyltransferase [Rhodospirillales bacterium]
MAVKVMYYVQHLLGIGHVARSLAIVKELVRRGDDVTLVMGGGKVSLLDAPAADLVQLPCVRAADETFKVLIGADGNPINDAWREKRRKSLLETFGRVKPDVLVIELFPFGRRRFRFELIPLLEAARRSDPRPGVVSSVRDILVDKGRPERARETAEWVEAYFDAVLVHGDPSLIPFERTFPEAPRIADKIRYTGYVIDGERLKGASAAAPGGNGVLVSSGGGVVGEKLLRTALAARPLSALKSSPWRLLAGPNMAEDEFNRLRSEAGEGITVERARSDFVSLLADCSVSVSQGGYNTVMEVLATGTRSVIVPFSAGGESEQTLRARLLEERGLVKVLAEEALNPESLAKALDLVIEEPKAAGDGIDLGGAETSARVISALAKPL